MRQVFIMAILFLMCWTKLDADEWNYSIQTIPQYDALFTKEKGWTGADGAYSIALSDTKTLWLYSDSFIGSIFEGRHKDATMVNNTIGIQLGKDISTDCVKFFWQTAKDGKEASFITPSDNVGWFWLFHGILANEKLYLFLLQTIKTDDKSVFGFQQTGTVLGEVDNPQDDPMTWRIHQYKVPFGRYTNKGNTFFGSFLIKDEGYIYIYGAKEDWIIGTRGMIVASVQENEIKDFSKWRFFGNGQWKSDLNEATELFYGLASEYSISFQPMLQKYVAIYTENGMSRNIMMRFSNTPVGPWSEPEKIYECPDEKWHNTYFCYAAKAHPELSEPDDIVITYVCNSTDFWQMASDARIYRPKFLRLKFQKK